MIDRLDLHALADGQLSDAQRKEILDQLATDPIAAAEYQSILAMKSTLKSCAEMPDSGNLWKKCQSRLDELDKTKRVESFVGRYAWGICGIFFLMIVSGGILNRRASGIVPSNQVSSFVASMSPVSVPRSQNQTELEPKLRQVVGAAFTNRPARMAITAVGESGVPGQRTRYVQLSDEFGKVAVLALYDVREVTGIWEYEADKAFRCGKIDGINSLFWNRGDGVICMVVGQRSYSELYDIVQAMCPTHP